MLDRRSLRRPPLALAPLLAAAAALAADPRPALAASDVCYKGGPTLANFKLNGDAFLDGSSIVITPDAGNKAGSAMYQTKFSTATDFHLKLVLKISTTSSIQPADGMAFVMHNDARGTTVVGGLGDGVGYQGILNSVVVEFDTYKNAWDPVNPHIAITRQGQASHTHVSNTGLPVIQFSALTPPINPVDGNPLHIWIDYAAATDDLKVFVASSDSKPASAALSAVLDLATELGADFYVGFTGSTGGAWDKHEFLELYATDTSATAKASCCDADADCAGSPHGGVCDTQKHVCGQCRFEETSGCGAGNTGCGLASSHNVCQVPCNGNFGSGAANACTSSTFPACRTSGAGAGSCGVCNGDFQSGASAACATGAPFCTGTGYCGRCTSNSQCTEAGSTHTGVVCNPTSGRCIGSCTLDSQCGTGNACVSGTCAEKAANGQPIPGGSCTVALGARFCVSAVCSTSNNTCGYANGTGSCTAGNAAVVCQSGACSAGANVCIPAASGSCFVDADCAAGNYCHRSTFTCTAKLAAGIPIPNDGLHGGTCTAAGAVACTSGACNTSTSTCAVANGAACTAANQCVTNLCGSNGQCGGANGDAGCTVGNTAVCQSGACSSANVCIPPVSGSCFVDADCAAGNYCHRSTFTCTAKLAAGAPIPNDGLHGGTCTAQGAAACASGACNASTSTCALANGGACTAANQCVVNLCGSNSQCGGANGDAGCTAATTGVCQSGACSGAGVCIPPLSGSCFDDADCAAGNYCHRSTFTCTGKLAAGGPIPSDGLHGGTCSAATAAAVCASGRCNATTNTCALGAASPCTVAAECEINLCAGNGRCGNQNGSGVCTAVTAPTVCQSGTCSAGGTCVPASGCFVDADCAAGSYCHRSTFTCSAKLAAGAPIPSDGLHDGTCAAAAAVCADGLCNASTSTCAAGLGATCTGASGCAVEICGSNGRCGIANGNGPCTVASGPALCQSGVCGDSSGLCLPPGAGSCDADADCPAGQFCDALALRCAARLAAGEPLPSDRLHDGVCSAALAALTCADGQCNPATDTCAQVVGATCSDAADCVADVCGGGTCGYLDGLGPCTVATAASVCQSGACSVSSICMPAASVSCYVDADCGAAEHCRRSTFTCLPKLVAGAAIPDDGLHGGTCAPSVAAAVCASGACNTASNTCAAANGGACTAANQCVVNHCGSNGSCGAANGDAGCTAASAVSFCQSGTCSSGGVCIPPISGSCFHDADCGAGFFCRRDTFTCLAKLGPGAPLPDDGLHGGACTGAVAAAVCSSGACNPTTATCGATLGAACTAASECQANACATNGQCGHLEGTGSCTAASAATDCQSRACSTAGVCIRPAGCWVDADCGSDRHCNRATRTCTAKLAPGAPIPDDGLHGGTCAAAPAVCLSGLCNPTTNTCAAALGADCTDASGCAGNTCGSNGKCGAAAGDGPCTPLDGATACQSGVCGPSGLCVPAGAGGCGLDGDCPAGQFCNAVTFTCEARLPAGAPLPSDRLHSGRCSDSLAAAVCSDGRCNPATDTCALAVTAACASAADCVANVCNSGGTCGFLPGTGACTADNAATVCASGRCSASAGVCLGGAADACWVDADCPGGSRCDRAAGVCKVKLAPGSPIPNDGLHDGTCTPDNASAVCDSGACNQIRHTCGAAPGAGCAAASECSNDVCGENGQCGHPAGEGSCTPANAASVCQSGICGAASGICAAAGAGGCGADADCAAGSYCDGQSRACKTRLAPGVALPDDGEHGDCVQGRSAACDSGLCNPDRRTCAAANGGGCTEAGQCSVNACGRNGSCGLADGEPGCTATTAALCQSGVCAPSGVCGSAGCVSDADCPGSAFCDGDRGLCQAKLAAGQRLPQDALHDGICTPALAQAACATGACNPGSATCAIPKGAGCTVGADCADGTCGSNGKCGLAAGQPGCTTATAATVCQSGFCSRSGRCKPAGADGCAADADCPSDRYCDGTALTCVAKLAPGTAIPRDGLHDDGCLPETAAALCASGVCNPRTGTCAAAAGAGCTAAAECVGNLCSNGVCGAPDGAGPCDAASAATVCQSGVCNVAARLCQPAGEGRCVRDADCIAGRFCARLTFTCQPTLGAGAPLPSDPLHPGTCDHQVAQALCASGMCNPATSTCATANDTFCDEARHCASNICHEGRCGLPDGQPCGAAAECRTGLCTGGACGPIPLEDIPVRASGGGGCACHLGQPTGGGAGLLTVIAGLLLTRLLARRRRRRG
jgi:hypothetical protein